MKSKKRVHLLIKLKPQLNRKAIAGRKLKRRSKILSKAKAITYIFDVSRAVHVYAGPFIIE